MSIRTKSDVPNRPLETELEQLFRQHSQMLYRTAYSLLDNAADSEDVLQNIFLRLLRNGLPPDLKRNAKGYFYRAAVNVSLDTIRSRKRREVRNLPQTTSAPPTDTEMVEETHRRLAEGLAELDPQAAQILILKYVHRYKESDIARLLGISRGAIAMRLLRSRFRLKQLMQESGEQR